MRVIIRLRPRGHPAPGTQWTPPEPKLYRLIADEEDAWVVQRFDTPHCRLLRKPKIAWVEVPA